MSVSLKAGKGEQVWLELRAPLRFGGRGFEGGLQGKKEQKIYTMFKSVLYVEIYNLTKCKAGLLQWPPSISTGQSVYKTYGYF